MPLPTTSPRSLARELHPRPAWRNSRGHPSHWRCRGRSGLSRRPSGPPTSASPPCGRRSRFSSCKQRVTRTCSAESMTGPFLEGFSGRSSALVRKKCIFFQLFSSFFQPFSSFFQLFSSFLPTFFKLFQVFSRFC